MNSEFLPIYAGIALILILQFVIILMQIKIMRHRKKNDGEAPRCISTLATKQAGNADGIVHCRECGERMDSAEQACPKCGAHRK